jgi:hypothetical protein
MVLPERFAGVGQHANFARILEPSGRQLIPLETSVALSEGEASPA